MLSEEEKKAIDKINRQITIGKCEKNIGIPVYIHDLETILNLIEKQQAQIEDYTGLIEHITIIADALGLEKDAPIDEMYEEINKLKSKLVEQK